MTEPHRDYLSGSNQIQLPNSTATLVLGILSIAVCFICGIIALVISNKDMAMYRDNPSQYTESSYNNAKAGRICAIIGVCLQVIVLVVYVAFIAFFVVKY